MPNFHTDDKEIRRVVKKGALMPDTDLKMSAR